MRYNAGEFRTSELGLELCFRANQGECDVVRCIGITYLRSDSNLRPISRSGALKVAPLIEIEKLGKEIRNTKNVI